MPPLYAGSQKEAELCQPGRLLLKYKVVDVFCFCVIYTMPPLYAGFQEEAEL